MKVIFVGCVESSFCFIRCVLTIPEVDVVGIVTRENCGFNADFYSLSKVAEENNIPCFIAEQHSESDMVNWCKTLSADVIYCFGWSYLLKKEMLMASKVGVIGYHPAELPKNRGRHPIIWALALGLERTASTFFLMDEGADSGDIVSQVNVNITLEDDAASLYQKLIQAGKQQIKDFTSGLIEHKFNPIKQDHSLSNYWRKRGKKDGLIDWRMSAQGVYNLVRALTYPYVGAHFEYKNREIKVWKSMVVDEKHCGNIEPGKVVNVYEDGVVDVQCGSGIIRLIHYKDETVFSKGEYLL